MKRFIKYIPLLFLLACQDLADLQPSETDTYAKFFGDPGDNYGVTLKETPSGDMLLLGYNEKADGSLKSYLIRTDSYGNLITSFGTNGTLTIPGMKATDLAINSNGYYIIGDSIYLSSLNEEQSHMMLVKSSTSGQRSGQVTIDSVVLTGTNTIHGSAILVEDDDEVIALGYQTIGINNNLIYLQYSFTQSSVQWVERINDRSYTPGKALVQNYADSKYNWVASSLEGYGFKAGPNEPQSGNIPLPDVTTAIDLDVNINNNRLGGIGNNSNGNLVFYEMDPSGGKLDFVSSNVLKTTIKVGESDQEISGTAQSISQVMTGGYIVLATVNENFILYRTDYQGQLTKPFTFAKYIDWVSRETSGAAIGTTDGGYAVFGSSEAGGASMMVLIKTDKNGNL